MGGQGLDDQKSPISRQPGYCIKTLTVKNDQIGLLPVCEIKKPPNFFVHDTMPVQWFDSRFVYFGFFLQVCVCLQWFVKTAAFVGVVCNRFFKKTKITIGFLQTTEFMLEADCTKC